MATFYGLGAILMWGLLALFGSLTISIPAFQLLFICFLISSLIMFVRRFLRKESLFRLPTLRLSQWLIGTSGLFSFHFLYFMALKQAPVLEVSLIVYLWPLLLAILVAAHGYRLQAMLGGLIGFMGIVVIMTSKGDLNLSIESSFGYLIALMCALVWSSYSTYLAKSPGEVDDIGWISLAVAVLSLLAHLALESDFSLSTAHWQFTSSAWLGAILLGLGPVGGAFYLWDLGLKQGNQSLLASLSFCAPLISSISLILVGKEPASITLIIAVALIMLGGFIANWRTRKTSHPVTEAL
ncbi:DMT family transporter [Pontibacterium sp.]|uniref:DMT family transporter n=1 Tax=Pontibacterium sp. TaxID=2036026 RepID=UPI003568EC7C